MSLIGKPRRNREVKEMKKNVNFQMANANDPEEIIHATQISVLEGLRCYPRFKG